MRGVYYDDMYDLKQLQITFFSAGFRSGVLTGACGKLGSLDRGGGRGSRGSPEQSSVKDNDEDMFSLVPRPPGWWSGNETV